jgi:ABC-type multidrug transport system, ATPase component
MIVAENLVKTYSASRREVRALDDLSLEVTEGTIMGLLGPNGAGKTTTVKVLTTLVTPDSGAARVGGVDVLADPERVKRMIGCVGAVRRRGRKAHRLREFGNGGQALPPSTQAGPSQSERTH